MNFGKLIYRIEEKFGIKDRRKESFLVEESLKGEKIFGEKEYIEFETSQGNFRLEEIRKPRILEKKVLSSKRIGGRTAIDYIYSKDEMINQVKLYKLGGDEWQEIDLKGLAEKND